MVIAQLQLIDNNFVCDLFCLEMRCKKSTMVQGARQDDKMGCTARRVACKVMAIL
jgi:hypothetical protein